MASDDHAAQSLLQTLTSGRSTHALFLDVDGTLLDIAAAPDQVRVPDGLPALISGLCQYLGGALALVSGREIPDIDQLFSPVAAPVAGAHGAQIRLRAGESTFTSQAAQPLSSDLCSKLVSLARESDLICEDKTYSVAIHFRNSPDQQATLRESIEAVLDAEELAGQVRPALMAGKMIYEIKYDTYNKGTALDDFLAHPPYAGRRPVVIGDDTTDEYAFARAVDVGGMAFSVGRIMPGAGAVFDSPEQVRRSLEQVLSGALTEIMNS